jgi:hypothetical protein
MEIQPHIRWEQRGQRDFPFAMTQCSPKSDGQGMCMVRSDLPMDGGKNRSHLLGLPRCGTDSLLTTILSVREVITRTYAVRLPY